MNAAYRLMGNFPSRGFGDSLSSADFNSVAGVVNGKDARLPMSGVSHIEKPEKPGEVKEAYHAFEIHPLSFGQLTVMYSATGTMMQANGLSTRPCSYTNAVTWAGADVPAYASRDEAVCRMLRYNGFVTLQELWVLPKNMSILPPKPWVEDASMRLDFVPPTPMSDEMLRSLLAYYWRAASLQFFGPWDSSARTVCQYQDDQMMQNIGNRERNFSVCISQEENCNRLVPQAKGFLWKVILSKLPCQVHNITSMAAAVPQAHAQSLYRDAAMCVVYPSPEATFNLNNGKYPTLERDEDLFIQQILKGNLGKLINTMHDHYQRATGTQQADACPFMADYDLALALYRIENAESRDIWTLLSNWYAVTQHLSRRHEIRDALLVKVMQEVDEYVASRLTGLEDEVVQLLIRQTDRRTELIGVRLQSFLWEKAICMEGDGGKTIRNIMVRCQGCPEATFFTELPAAQMIPVNENAHKRMAELVSEVLNTHHVEESLSNQLVQQLIRITSEYSKSKLMHEKLARYLVTYQNRHPEDIIRLLQLSTQYLNVDEQAGMAFEKLKDRLSVPITQDECRAIGKVWPEMKTKDKAQKVVNAYLVALYNRYFNVNLDVVSQILTTMGWDSTDMLIDVLTQEPSCSNRLEENHFAHVLGQSDKDESILALANAQRLPEVEQAYRIYLQHHLKLSIQQEENLYGWIVRIINLSLVTRLYPQKQNRENFLEWCNQLVLDYTIEYAKRVRQLPEEDAFKRLLNLAKNRSPLFEKRMPQVIDAYEGLLQANVAGTVGQAEQLVPYLYGIKAGSRLQEIAGADIRALLRQELKADKALFWHVMCRKDVVANIRRVGVLPDQIFDGETKAAAEQCMHRELDMIGKADEYKHRYDSYALKEAEFRNGIGAQNDTTISEMWRKVAADHFLRKFDLFFQACGSIDKANTLMRVAEVVDESKRATASNTGKIINRLSEAKRFLDALSGDAQGMSDQMIKRAAELAGELQKSQSSKALQLVCHECNQLQNTRMNFVRQVAVALLSSVVANGCNWTSFLHVLEPKMENMLRDPYASGSLSLLATVSSVLKLLEAQENLLKSFANYLNHDSSMAAYTEAVRKDKKMMAHFFPGYENSSSLRIWLNPEGGNKAAGQNNLSNDW